MARKTAAFLRFFGMPAGTGRDDFVSCGTASIHAEVGFWSVWLR